MGKRREEWRIFNASPPPLSAKACMVGTQPWKSALKIHALQVGLSRAISRQSITATKGREKRTTHSEMEEVEKESGSDVELKKIVLEYYSDFGS